MYLKALVLLLICICCYFNKGLEFLNRCVNSLNTLQPIIYRVFKLSG